jgi:hypothetical protein
MSEEVYYVYEHIRPSTGKVFYVGKINDPGFWEKIGNFFMDLWDKIKSLFS